MLSETVAARTTKSLDTLEIRQQLTTIVTGEDVQATNNMLVHEVLAARQPYHVIVDTNLSQQGGLWCRITAFTVEQSQALNLMRSYAHVRPRRSWNGAFARLPRSGTLIALRVRYARKITDLRAAQYDVVLGRPSYFLNASPPLYEVFEKFLTVTKMS
jgi:hypothetical protein